MSEPSKVDHKYSLLTITWTLIGYLYNDDVICTLEDKDFPVRVDTNEENPRIMIQTIECLL